MKDDNLKLAKNFNTLPTGKGKVRGTGIVKGKSQKQTDKQYKYGKVKEKRKKQDTRDQKKHQESQRQDLLLVTYSPGLDNSSSRGIQTQGGTSQPQSSKQP